MKKIGLFILGLCAIFFVGGFTQAKDYEYTNLYISAKILNDGTINVKEDFTANFFVNKHGIIRDIPLNYSVGGKNFHIEISNIDVEGKHFTKDKSNGEWHIKIGDANRTVIGEQNYPISYSTYGLIRNFSGMGYAELYWNLVGYDFDTNINKVKAEIILPKEYTGFTTGDFLITTDGRLKTIDGFEGSVDRSQGDRIIITYDKGLSAYHGITLTVIFLNDYFVFDHNRQAGLIGKIGNNLFDNLGISSWGPLVLMIGLFLGVFVFFAFVQSLFKKLVSNLDNKFGDLKGDLKGNLTKQNSTIVGHESPKGILELNDKSGDSIGNVTKEFPVIVQYEPPKGINSAEAGLLLNRKAQVKHLLSLIYKRATEGLINISIEKTEGSIFSSSKDIVVLSKVRDISEEAPDYEKNFFKSIISGEKNKIEKSTNLYNAASLYSLDYYGEKMGRFDSSKNNGKVVLGSILIFFFLNCVLHSYSGLWLVLFGIFIFGMRFLGMFERHASEKGAKLISHILGYKEFISACDENKLRLFLKEDPLYFDKILPYAVVFGLETELLKKIEPIMKEMNIKSSWYDGNISSMYIINDIFSSAATHSTSSYNSDSGFSGGSSFGGGFSSGGGGGGGGGRSW